MYLYFVLTALFIIVLALSIFAKNTAIFQMFFPGIHEPLTDGGLDDIDENTLKPF